MAGSLKGRLRDPHWKKEAPLIAVMAAVFFVMLVFTAITPMLADDFSYCFSWADDSRIRSVFQIPASMAAHRQVTNGRVVAHGLVQGILMLPKGVFDVLNALCALLMARLFLEYFSGLRPAQAALLLCCGAFLLWNDMPAFGQVFLWLDGAVNYFWGICLFLLFLRPYAMAWLGRGSRRTPWRDALFLLLALAVGCYSENGSVSVIFAALCLTGLLALRRQRPRPVLLLGIVFACVGFAFLMSAPATSGRAAPLTISGLALNLRELLNAAKETLSGLYGLYALSLALCLLSGADRRKLLLSAVFLLAGAAALACYIFATYFVPRHFCFTVLFTVLACLLLLSALLEQGKKLLPAAVTALAAVAFCFNFLLGALDMAVIFRKSLVREEAVAAALAAGERSVTLEIYVPDTKYSAAYGLLELNTSGEGWPNISLARYYGLDQVKGVEPAG